jgi:hypothetical protein
LRNPRYIPGDCSFNAQGQSLFSAYPSRRGSNIEDGSPIYSGH